MKINRWSHDAAPHHPRQSGSFITNGALITEPACKQLIEACRAGLPNEACGVLAYSGDGAADITGMPKEDHNAASSASAIKVDIVYPIRNMASHSARAFHFHPKDWIDAYYAIQKNRQSLVGFYHSHPASLPAPSTADYSGMQYSTIASYWIVSFVNPESPVIQPYRFHADSSRFEPLMLAQIGV